MHNRRNFLLQSGMAVTSLLVAKPYKSVAGISGCSLLSGNPNQIVFLHTSLPEDSRVVGHINALQKEKVNQLLINTGKSLKYTFSKIKFDVSPGEKEFITNQRDYHITHKGNVKIGIIIISTESKDENSRVNTISEMLKKEKKCHLVVCLSDLGYKNDHGPDDIKLAKASSNLDVIISGHAKNFSENPNIILNGNNEEVIISHSAGSVLGLGKFSIGFNSKMQKNNIAF